MPQAFTIKTTKSAPQKNDVFGWTVSEDMVKNYSDACLQASENDDLFKRFKKIENYRPILEGGPKLLFDTYLNHIDELENSEVFFNNLEKFRINDTVGDPDLYEESRIGEFSGSTLKFAFNALEIIHFIQNNGGDLKSTKNIVEIGGGYGGLCLILSGFIDFDTYTLVDIPNACKLVEKYVAQFPQLKGKVKTLPCTELSDDSFDDIDLAIGINSVNECTRETQLEYFSKIFSKSEFSYLVRNPDTQERRIDHQTCLNSLPDNFLVDDSERVERDYSSQIVVYIKREG